MVFSSSIFLFCFLPCCLFGYYVLFRKSRKAQNGFLLFCSLLFYTWGGAAYVLLMLASIVANWGLTLAISRTDRQAKKKCWLILAILFNVGMLFVFKYLRFTLTNINLLFRLDLPLPEIALPIGISFFTFQGMSYVIDVYRGGSQALRNPLEVGLYISFFPQLIAGPIVRYETVAEQIHHRVESTDLMFQGVRRFIIGLVKKAVIANTLAIPAKLIFSYYYRNSVACAWLGIVAYTLQIYFDFSGYSDMAIGLGKMFGFTFEENFKHPYISSSITEFWRRWHISMGSWFRDYVYIPLGGSRTGSAARTFFNLFVVWLLTGIWHGANWTFIVWGMLQFLVIALERLLRPQKTGSTEKKRGAVLKRIFGHVYSLFVIMIGWVFFNSDSISAGLRYCSAMFGVGTPVIDPLFGALFGENLIVLLAAVILCFPIREQYEKRCEKLRQKLPCQIVETVGYTALLILAVVYTVKGAYNPFIYFNF